MGDAFFLSVVLRYIMKSDFEAEAGDYTPEPMASSTSASDHPSDGLCLSSWMGLEMLMSLRIMVCMPLT